MKTITKVQKWGNSLAVRIPVRVAKKLSLTHGSAVRFEDERAGSFTVVPVKRKRFTIDERIAGITPENLNVDRVWLSMKPVGKEIF